MIPNQLAARLNSAINSLYLRDAFLLEHNVAERCIVSKLAGYMTPLFRRHDVDVEYNRRGVRPSDAKTLPGFDLLKCSAVQKALDKGKKDINVFPDIIVHRRGVRFKSNLLVVEVKRQSNSEPRACDDAKIRAMMQKYRYRFGVFIDLPSGPGATREKPKLVWGE